jgi:hypothetical protein
LIITYLGVFASCPFSALQTLLFSENTIRWSKSLYITIALPVAKLAEGS